MHDIYALFMNNARIKVVCITDVHKERYPDIDTYHFPVEHFIIIIESY